MRKLKKHILLRSRYLLILVTVASIAFNIIAYIGEARTRDEMTCMRDRLQTSNDTLVGRIDSLTLEMEKLRAGIDESSVRRFKVFAAANIIREFAKTMNETDALRLAGIIYDACEKTSGVEFSFVMAIIATESRFNNNVVSPAGAVGIMQVMPTTFEYVARSINMDVGDGDASNLRKNIIVGIHYLARMRRTFSNNRIAAAAYNGGPGGGAVYGKYLAGEVPAERVHPETMAYADKVMKYYSEFKRTICD